jgi:hypothetical protein
MRRTGLRCFRPTSCFATGRFTALPCARLSPSIQTILSNSMPRTPRVTPRRKQVSAANVSATASSAALKTSSPVRASSASASGAATSSLDASLPPVAAAMVVETRGSGDSIESRRFALDASERFTPISTAVHDNSDPSSSSLSSSSSSSSSSVFSHVAHRARRLLAAGKTFFLPEGYPQSVTPDYLPFQMWDTLQAVSSYLRGIMCVQARTSAHSLKLQHTSTRISTIQCLICQSLAYYFFQ